MTDKKSDAEKAVDKDPEGVAEKGNARVQKVADSEVDAGLRGTEADTTPNDHYTLQGVVAGKPVPETQANPHVARLAAHADNQD